MEFVHLRSCVWVGTLGLHLQEAIAVLMACRRFGIHGADATIRKMLPLVFSRDPGRFHRPFGFTVVFGLL